MKTSKFKPVLLAAASALCVLAFNSCDKKPNTNGHHKMPNEKLSEPHGKQHSDEMHKKYNFKSETHGKQHSDEDHQKYDYQSVPQTKQGAPSSRAPQTQPQPQQQPQTQQNTTSSARAPQAQIQTQSQRVTPSARAPQQTRQSRQ